jgi:hypothetical protein
MVASAAARRLQRGSGAVAAAAWRRWAKLPPAVATAQQHGSGSMGAVQQHDGIGGGSGSFAGAWGPRQIGNGIAVAAAW